MGRLKTICITLCAVLCYFQAQGADKYTDQNRPYEFGFTIDGEQHRHEKKDENGIIMGEFGFITADGVYHVTVYATDENGNFKIISMKNIRVKPYPTAPDTGGRKGHSLPFPSTQQLSTTAKTIKAEQKDTSSLKACSHCKLLTTTKTPPIPSVLPTNDNFNKQKAIAGNSEIDGKSKTFEQNNKKQQVYSQHGNSFTRLSSQSNQEQSYQQGSISSQLEQNNPSPAQSYPNQANNFINKQYSQNLPSQQNYPQDDFNVGREYLQKTQGQPNYQQKQNVKPNSLIQSGVALNSQQGFDIGQQQGIIDGQYNLQPPYETRNNQESLPSSLTYPNQAAAKVQDISAPTLGQSYKTNNEQNYVQKLNTNDNNNYGQNEIYRNKAITPGQTLHNSQEIATGDRQPKTFMDILQKVNSEQQYKAIGSTPNSYASTQQNVKKPVLVAAQMQIVDKNTNIYQKTHGENEGLPDGLTKGDMTDLLYTFNYTVGFHGHHEEGYRSGAKVGYYYVTARSGVRTRVDYVADEKGFHPRISQEVLDVQSDEVPKLETEKDEKYGLKGYEFKWLYYPVDSK